MEDQGERWGIQPIEEWPEEWMGEVQPTEQWSQRLTEEVLPMEEWPEEWMAEAQPMLQLQLGPDLDTRPRSRLLRMKPASSNFVESSRSPSWPNSKQSYTSNGKLKRYARFLVKYPCVNIIIVLFVSLWAALIGFLKPLGAQNLPDFSQPLKGFEPRGSVISSRSSSYKNLEHLYNYDELNSLPPGSLSSSRLSVKRRSARSSLFDPGCSVYGSTGLREYVDTNKIIYKSSGNLLSAANLRAICRLQDKIMQSSSYFFRYISHDYALNRPCPSFSIPNYITSYSGLGSCSELTDSHVAKFVQLLQECSGVYRNGLLKKCIDHTSCANLPANCTSKLVKNMVYNVFRYLGDSSFSHQPTFLKTALVTEKLTDSYSLTDTLYKSVYEKELKDLKQATSGKVQVAAFQFHDLRFTIFSTQLLTEASLIAIALVLVLFAVWMYSGSIFIGLMTFACVILALVLAYFIYGIVFRLPFFPFLNVLTLIFLVGIGADDAFVYMGVYSEAKTMFPYQHDIGYEDNLTNWTAYTLKRALLAMFVTSFTTAAAFYSSLSSTIIAVRCFSVYAGTSILVNYLLMVTWFPAIVVLHDKYLVPCLHICCPGCCSARADRCQTHEHTTMSAAGGHCSRLFSKLSSMAQKVFEEVLACIIIKARYICVILLFAIGIGGVIIVFVTPKLKLPSSSEFHMFSDSSSLEQYSLHYKSKFSFEFTGNTWYLPIHFVFGVKSEDTRNKFNPDDVGKVILNPSFDMVSPNAQKWLYRFCSDLRNASFVDPLQFHSSTCDRVLKLWSALSLPCDATIFRFPCCNRTVPVRSNDFDFCLRTFIKYIRPQTFQTVLFDGANKTRALVVYVSSNVVESVVYDRNNKFFDSVESWLKTHKADAPEGFKDGWWKSDLTMYDLQKSLARGTERSLAISVGIAFVVLLLTTWNLIISLYSILSIGCVIAVSVGILVLSGWRLNIVESIVISTAAGLAVDFTIHYGIAYRISPRKDDQKERVRYALTHIGPAVAMGALTTFIAGLVMAPASVLAYLRLSDFLMLVMTVSWMYATFFFLPLCSIIGPKGNFCQLAPKRCKKIPEDDTEHLVMENQFDID